VELLYEGPMDDEAGVAMKVWMEPGMGVG
jgi:hypothetical protein